MKRRFRILVALVMSLTMMFGMSTTALADINWDSYYRPESVNPSSDEMIYVVDIDESLNNPVLVFYYNPNGSKILSESGRHGNDYKTRSVFADDPEVGKVYIRSSSDNKFRLDENNPNPYLPPSPSPEPNGETPSVPSCDHDFKWQTITSATATTYGTEGDVCSKCGATRNVRTKSPLDDWVRMQINNAKPGDVLKLNFGPWNSYPLWMMQMIADKPTVTYIFNYTYQGNKYEVTIKPGDKFALDCDWYGPAKMPTLFDTVITKW